MKDVQVVNESIAAIRDLKRTINEAIIDWKYAADKIKRMEKMKDAVVKCDKSLKYEIEMQNDVVRKFPKDDHFPYHIKFPNTTVKKFKGASRSGSFFPTETKRLVVRYSKVGLL